MIKKILIFSVVLLIGIIGWIITLSYYYNSSFTREAEILVSRVDTYVRYKDEVDFVKYLLKEVISEEQPPKDWEQHFTSRWNTSSTYSFYVLKVWFITAQITIEDIDRSYAIYSFLQKNRVTFDLDYKRSEPRLQCTVLQDPKKAMKADFAFPLNNCLFNADYNRDHKVDNEDVKLARESLAKYKKKGTP